MDYFTGRAAAELPKSDPFHDDPTYLRAMLESGWRPMLCGKTRRVCGKPEL